MGFIGMSDGSSILWFGAAAILQVCSVSVSMYALTFGQGTDTVSMHALTLGQSTDTDIAQIELIVIRSPMVRLGMQRQSISRTSGGLSARGRGAASGKYARTRRAFQPSFE